MDNIIHEEVHRKILAAIREYDDLLTLVKKCKRRWVGHSSRSSCLAKMILQGTVIGNRRRDRQKKRLENNSKERIGMDYAGSNRAAETGQDRKGWLRSRLWCVDILISISYCMHRKK